MKLFKNSKNAYDLVIFFNSSSFKIPMKKTIKLGIILSMLFLTMPFLASAQSNAWKENFGRIKRLYPTSSKFLFSLKDGVTTMDPEGGFYYIPLEHKNYRTLSDLLFKAAENQWVIQVNLYCCRL